MAATPVPEPKRDQEIDAVSQLQGTVDGLALAMFDALRLIPPGDATLEDKQWEKQVKVLGEKVLRQAAKLDEMIDTLPGADKTEEEQLQELRELHACSEGQRFKLKEAVQEVEELHAAASLSLDEIARTILQGI
ncbi:unnamed protein product [Chrysoparadoxa australica]